jgi:hypothetical protein
MSFHPKKLYLPKSYRHLSIDGQNVVFPFCLQQSNSYLYIKDAKSHFDEPREKLSPSKISFIVNKNKVGLHVAMSLWKRHK